MKTIFLFLTILYSGTLLSQDWKEDFSKTKDLATNENKNIVLVFSGSDWCAPCIKLDKNIWQSQEFQNYANEHWILYRADFPRKKANKLSEKITKTNSELAEKYNKDGMFPLVLVLNSDGKVLGTTGFQNVSPDEFIKILKAFEI